MTAHSKTHQALLKEWSIRIADQASSGLTVRAWCNQNNLTLHKYNYWKHLLKENSTDKVIPDIVPISIPTSSIVSQNESPRLPDFSNSSNGTVQTKSSNQISVTINDIRIDISADSIYLLHDIIKAVRYA